MLDPFSYPEQIMEANFSTIAEKRRERVKALEAAVRIQTIEQLNIAIKRKDEFLSTMSHELRSARPADAQMHLAASSFQMGNECRVCPTCPCEECVFFEFKGVFS